MEFKNVGYEIESGFKIGEKVLYNGSIETIIGFLSEKSGKITFLVSSHESYTTPKNSYYKSLVTTAKIFIDTRFVWASNFEKIGKIEKECYFTKQDLKSGDQIIYRNGSERFVLIETGSIHDTYGMRSSELTNFKDDLLFMTPTGSFNENFDIVKVYRSGKLIYERLYTPTEEEIKSVNKEIDRMNKRFSELRKLGYKC